MHGRLKGFMSNERRFHSKLGPNRKSGHMGTFDIEFFRLEKSGDVRIETKTIYGFIQQILLEKWGLSGKA